MMSFHSFLAASAKYSRQIHASRRLVSAAIEPIDIAMDRLFGKSTVK
jgi:hypothetical protein